MNSNKLRRIGFDPQRLVDICKTRPRPYKRSFTCDGLPSDTQFVRAAVVDIGDGNPIVQLVVESDEFDEVPAGQMIPEVHPCFTEQECKRNGNLPNKCPVGD